MDGMTGGTNYSGDEDGEGTRGTVGAAEVLYQGYPVGVWGLATQQSSSWVSVTRFQDGVAGPGMIGTIQCIRCAHDLRQRHPLESNMVRNIIKKT